MVRKPISKAATRSTPTSRESILPAKTRKTPLWKGPYEDGITFSLLSRFLVCRHRFWLRTVCGVTEDMGFNHALEYGSMWHTLEECHSGGGSLTECKRKLWDYCESLSLKYNTIKELEDINKWGAVCETQFPIYIDCYKHDSTNIGRQPLLEEVAFKVPYTLPSGRTLLLRGKFDCVFRLGNGIWLQENKTKGQIDVEGIEKTVDRNLQTMLYLIALNSDLGNHINLKPKDQLSGTLYNVVRRPLADKFAIRQKVKESDKDFYKRLGASIRKKMDYFFVRRRVTVTSQMIESFKLHTFNSILEQLCDWWDSIVSHEFNPWSIPLKEISIPNPYHWQAPWGIYDNLAIGFRGDYFDFLSRGDSTGLQHINNLYPELEE